MKRKNKALVGIPVHYVNRGGVHHAAIVTYVYQSEAEGNVDLYIIANVSWRKPRHQASVCYSKKPLNRTWHYIADDKRGK
jgi:hypothetical protein